MTSKHRTEDDVLGHILHHPFVATELVLQHRDELRADADQRWLAAEARRAATQDTAARHQRMVAFLEALGRRTRRASV
jgi:hypothetical protein